MNLYFVGLARIKASDPKLDLFIAAKKPKDAAELWFARNSVNRARTIMVLRARAANQELRVYQPPRVSAGAGRILEWDTDVPIVYRLLMGDLAAYALMEEYNIR